MSDHSSQLKNLSDLDPKKLEIIEFVISSCQGKPLEQILPDLMAAASRLSEQGLSFTNEEISMIMDGLRFKKAFLLLSLNNRGSHRKNEKIVFLLPP